MRRSLLGLVLALALPGCGKDPPAGSATPPAACVADAGAYPQGELKVQLGSVLPDLSFQGDRRTTYLHDYFEPCAARSRLLVIRVSAEWCGTCRWQAAHTGEIRALDIGPRLRFLDLVVADLDNQPAVGKTIPTTVTPWRARIDAPEDVASDAAFRLAPLRPAVAPLPLIVLVDTRTMRALVSLDNPPPETLESRLRQELAKLDGLPVPADRAPEKTDGRFYRNQWDVVREMTFPAVPPADPTNAKGDDPSAAALGKQLFADTALSPSGKVACATCHDPARHLADGEAQSTGVSKVDRNAPSILLATHSRWQFWDGRADSAWMQATGPIEADKEMASSRLYVAHQIRARYRSAYEAVFGALPPLEDTARFPATGKPGETSWAGMSPVDQKSVNRVFANVGKSIHAFERTFRVKPNRLDAYVAGDKGALTDEEKDGLFSFFTTGCAQCHYGPRLTDDAFHAVRFPTGRQDGAPDRGRIDAVGLLLASEFNGLGEFSDKPNASYLRGQQRSDWFLGSFKTPPLRGVANTAPYGHGGTVATLEDSIKLYSTAGLAADDPTTVGVVEPWIPRFEAVHVAPLVAFMRVLTADPAAQ